MEGWVNNSFQFFSLEKDRNELERAQQWDGYKDYVINEDGYMTYIFHRNESIRLDDLLWFINIGFIRITGGQCIILFKKLIEKYTDMKRKQINHGNLGQKTIWLVMDFSKSGCQLNFDYRPLYYKIHFTGFSLSPQKDDDICMIDIFNLIIQMMPKMQTNPEQAFNLKQRQIPYIVKVQQSLYTTLHTGIDQFYKLVETYFTSHLDHQQQYLKGMDQNFRELDPIRIAIRADIIKDINQKSEISNNNNDFMNNLKVDNSVRNAVCYLLSLNCLYKGQVEFKAQWQMVEENQKWKEFLLSLNENKNHIYELILNFQDSMNKELSYTFKFEVKVPIQDIKQWIKQKMFKLIFHSQIKSQYLNSSQQFNTFILQGQKINYTLINQQILQEYANLHEKAFIKYIEELIEELE